MGRISLLALAALLVGSHSSQAAPLDGAALSWPWSLPFAGLLLTIATGPLLFPKIWHAHYGKITVCWSMLALAPIAATFGIGAAVASLAHALLGLGPTPGGLPFFKFPSCTPVVTLWR
jgi:hypothetical protein